MEPRAYKSGAAGTPPILTSEYSAGYPYSSTDTTAATVAGAYWFYGWGEELRNVLINCGITPITSDNTQFLQAVLKIAEQSTPPSA